MHSGESFSSNVRPDHRDIPSLDGLRAISILLVIFAHAAWDLPEGLRTNQLFHLPVGNGMHGVGVFFVISGFLITGLLLREMEKTGDISLRRFYFRRTMRIFPAFYVYLLVEGMLSLRGIVPHNDWKSFLASATYTWCYYPKAQGYLLTHTWSLSIEEQFYLFWPALLLFLHKRRQLIAGCVAIVIGMPVLRVALYFLCPKLRGHEFYMIHGWLDVMMVGCLLSCVQRGHENFARWKNGILNGKTAFALTFIAFFLDPYILKHLRKPWSGAYALAFHPTVLAVCVAGILLYVVEKPRTLCGRFLNLKWVRRLGVLSYSLYLWQQLIVYYPLHLLPYGFALLLLIAMASFWLIEQPFLRLRAQMEKRAISRSAIGEPFASPS